MQYLFACCAFQAIELNEPSDFFPSVVRIHWMNVCCDDLRQFVFLFFLFISLVLITFDVLFFPISSLFFFSYFLLAFVFGRSSHTNWKYNMLFLEQETMNDNWISIQNEAKWNGSFIVGIFIFFLYFHFILFIVMLTRLNCINDWIC